VLFWNLFAVVACQLVQSDVIAGFPAYGSAAEMDIFRQRTTTNLACCHYAGHRYASKAVNMHDILPVFTNKVITHLEKSGNSQVVSQGNEKQFTKTVLPHWTKSGVQK